MAGRNALSDLVKAVQLLQPEDPVTCGQIAKLLGIKPYKLKPLSGSDLASKRVSRDASSEMQSARFLREDSTASNLGSEVVAEPIESVFTEVESEVSERPLWLTNARYIQRESAPVNHQPLPFDPLFQPRWTRAILSNLLSVSLSSMQPDIALLLKNIARFTPTRRIPIRTRSSTASLIYLLVDRSQTMEYFSLDQNVLSLRLASIFGRDRFRTLIFESDPWGAEDPRGAISPFEERARTRGNGFKLAPRSLVLSLSNMGCSSGAKRPGGQFMQDWIDFSRAVESSGSHLLVLNPLPACQWPVGCRPPLNIVQWDRSVTLSAVLKFVRSGRKNR